MSRKRCIRKHYPKTNPIALAIEGARVTDEDRLDKLRLRELAAIDNFAQGTAMPADFRDVCDILNLTETFALTGVGAEALPTCERVEEILMKAKEQFEREGHMSVTDSGLKALRDLYEYHDLMRTSVGRSDYERVIQKTANKIRGAHPSVKVLA